MGPHTALQAPRTNVFGLPTAYGHVPTPAERRAVRRRKATLALRSVGESVLLVAAVAAWAFVLRR